MEFDVATVHRSLDHAQSHMFPTVWSYLVDAESSVVASGVAQDLSV